MMDAQRFVMLTAIALLELVPGAVAGVVIAVVLGRLRPGHSGERVNACAPAV